MWYVGMGELVKIIKGRVIKFNCKIVIGFILLYF